MRLVFMGPPGAGKGTQAGVLAGHARSTAYLHRGHLSSECRSGNRTRGAGEGIHGCREYVPDSITNAMVRDRLTHDDCRPGFLLDGFPRTVEQVAELDAMLTSSGHHLNVVVELTVDVDEVVSRLVKRAQEQGANR